MSVTNFLHSLNGPLLVEPRVGRVLVGILMRKLAGATFSGADLHTEIGIAMPEQRAAAQAKARDQAAETGIAIIPIVGIISQRPSSLGASTDQIGAMVDAAVASKHIDAILFDVDSPGGVVTAVPETAARIREAGKVKPTLTLSNGLMASAAYWLGAAANEVWITPSGEAGSIGVWTAHEDWSGKLEKEGVKITPISAGKFKLEGAFWEPLSEEAQAHLQSQVDEVFGWFVKDVASFRKDTQANVRAGYGQGRVLMAEQAVKANLADKIGTMDEAIARLAAKVGASRKTRASIDRDRLALDAARLSA